jgi:S-(hydroxymethyl)glutathione dehydrogenase/alcohol dehydrogenase
MQAALLVGTKRPLVIEEVELDPPRAGEVHVRVAASGVCHSCLHSMDGTGGDSPYPMVLGDEGAGVVERVGEGVSHLRPGDHVVISWASLCGTCEACLTGYPATCAQQPPFGFLRDGTVRMHRSTGEDVHHFGTAATYASEIVVPADCAIKIRDDMPLDVAALLGCAITTGVGAVTNTAGVRPGTSVAVFGCGGIGLSSVMGAVLAGANPIIAIDVKPEKLELAKRIGATHGVLGTDPDAVAQIREISGGGVRTAVLGVGIESVVQQAWAALGPRGTAVMIPFMGLGAKLTIDPLPLIRFENRLIGSRYGSSLPAVEFPRLADLYMEGRLPIDAIITKRYPLDEINEAHRALAAGENARGVIVFD